MTDMIYEYKTQGKTLASLAFLITAIAVVMIGANTGIAIYIYIPIGFALLFGAWWFMNNPNHGCRLTSDALELWANKESRNIDLATIISAEAIAAEDGSRDTRLTLQDGSSVAVSDLQSGRADEFLSALVKAGVKVAA